MDPNQVEQLAQKISDRIKKDIKEVLDQKTAECNEHLKEIEEGLDQVDILARFVKMKQYRDLYGRNTAYWPTEAYHEIYGQYE